MLPPFDAVKYIYSLPDIWERIFSFLDAGSLMTFAETVPELEHVAFQTRSVRALKFMPDTDERTIRYFEEAKISNHVERLDFSNCVALSSAILLGCASRCSNMRDLCFVNCVVQPAQLFALLDTKLTQVRNLEWSLHECWLYKSWPLDDIQLKSIQLETMYVELVAWPENVFLLELILHQCSRLQHLHIHAIQNRGASVQMADRCAVFARLLPSLSTFEFTCERIFDPEATNRWAPRPVQAEDVMFGNIIYRLEPVRSRNKVIFEDKMEKGQLRGVGQAIVVMEAADHMERRRLYSVVARPECWTDISSLCLVLSSPRGEQLSRIVTASSYHIDATHLFFKICMSNITELSLAAFHFDHGSDGSAIVGSTLPQLRALALTPCSVNQAESLMFLSRGCRNLELLDVRAERDSNGDCLCEFCQTPLRFTEAGFRELHEKTKLRRLCLDDTAKMASLNFLRECRAVELRFSLNSLEPEVTNAASSHVGLSSLGGFDPSLVLRANPRLSVLMIAARGVQLRHDAFAENLATISTLRHLCILTEAETTEDNVASFFGLMQAGMPLLEILHTHHTDSRRVVIPTTWLRQRHPATIQSEIGKQRRLGGGVLLQDRPCIGCYRRSFIGLVKPRNRD